MTQIQDQNFRKLLAAWNQHQDARSTSSYQEIYQSGRALDRARSSTQLSGPVR